MGGSLCLYMINILTILWQTLTKKWQKGSCYANCSIFLNTQKRNNPIPKSWVLLGTCSTSHVSNNHDLKGDEILFNPLLFGQLIHFHHQQSTLIGLVLRSSLVATIICIVFEKQKDSFFYNCIGHTTYSNSVFSIRGVDF